jgi:diguanylate cyclase (GGDEF)-like protein
VAGKHIVLADDSSTVVAMLTALLQSAGYRVTSAVDGVSAVEKAFAERPDLVLLDVTMPHMNGYQACRLLKSDPALRDTPVLLLTSKDQASDRFWGARSGADCYLTKECAPAEILDVIAQTLAERANARAAAPASPTDGYPEGRHDGPDASRPSHAAPTPTAPARTSREPAPNCQRDLLSRLNDLLDRRLFQATILNEIARLSRSLQDLEQCANAVMKTLSQLADYHLAGIALAQEDPGELYVRQAKPVSRLCLDRFEKDCFNALAAQQGRAPACQQWRVNIFDESTPGAPAQDLEQLITLPLESDRRPVGLLALAGGRQMAVAQQDQQLLSALADQVHIVLDNARLYRKVQIMAVSDELTGLYNFRHLRERLAEEFARARRYGSELSLMLLDIDHFKAVNDRCGHQTGNLVLTQVVAIIRAQLREGDLPARYGGEEFAVILPMTGAERGMPVAERLRAEVAGARFGVPDDPLRLTVSIGVASFPAQPLTAPDELITEADNALYAAKAAGRNCVRHACEPKPVRPGFDRAPT